MPGLALPREAGEIWIIEAHRGLFEHLRGLSVNVSAVQGSSPGVVAGERKNPWYRNRIPRRRQP